MVLQNNSQTENSQRFDEVLAPYFSQYHREKCYPGLVFEQGKRTMVQINVPAHDLPTLLQAKPSMGNDPDSGKNRPEVKGHAEEIKEYILKRAKKNKPWILGTLTANISPEKVELVELGRGFCLVIFQRGVKLDITDGQHRKRAIHELVESLDSEYISDNDFPITLVLEEDFKQCQTDFRDMAQTRQLDKSLLLSFGEFEGRVGITKRVIEKVTMFQDKTEKIKVSPETKKKLIHTTNFIAKAVSCAFSDDPSNELRDYNVESASNALINCFNQFFSECSQTDYISNSIVEDLTISQVSNFKEDCLLGRSVGLEILGRLLYITYNKYSMTFDVQKVSRLAELDWSRGSHLWEGNVVLTNYDPQSPTAKPYRITASVSAVKMAVNKAKIHLGWM